MVVNRGRKRPESPSSLSSYQTPQHQRNGATNQSSPQLRASSRGSGASGNVHIKHLSKSTPSLSSSMRRRARIRATTMLAFLFMTVFGLFYLSYGIFMENMKKQEAELQLRQHTTVEQLSMTRDKAKPKDEINSQKKEGNSSTQVNHDKCAFRSYPSNRLYGLSSNPQPKFLSEAAYIRGQLPTIINPNENDNKIETDGKSIHQTSPVKVCLDTTSWEDLIDKDGKERLPFTDGHNPSVISLAPNPYYSTSSDLNNNQQHMRLEPKHLEPLASVFPTVSLDSLFLGVSIFGGGQCKFGFSPEEVDTYRFSLHEEPPGGKRAVIAVLAPPNGGSSNPFQTLAQTTLLLERDAKYGTSRKKALPPQKTTDSGSGFARMHQEFDDPRLFFHLGRVWVLYRNGPLFGYTDQIHNPIHFEKVVSSSSEESTQQFVAYVKASETVWVGGGRNIALISEEPIGKNENGEVEWVSSPSLKALTWVDPVTVKDDIDLRGVDAKLSSRRLLEEVGNENESKREEDVIPSANLFPSEYHRTSQHRRLGSKPTKSNVHGTNGYMVPLTSTGELLGIAHFHRPENRKSSDFALHGHHYTHAFFTIARQAPGENANDIISSRSFKLKRLSNEFVFRANSIPAGETQSPVDGDIIQFASGLDVVKSDVDGQLIISYGINDCEGAVFTLSMQKVQQMLIEVGSGQEVVDLMENVAK